jgi:hypothetical protein
VPLTPCTISRDQVCRTRDLALAVGRLDGVSRSDARVVVDDGLAIVERSHRPDLR